MPPFNSIIRSCEVCRKEILLQQWAVKKGARFCSTVCVGISQRTTREEKFVRGIAEAVDQDGCLLWLGARTKSGYGQIRSRYQKTVFAHRYSYELAFGKFNESLFVLHKCDNPPCVNPLHLFLGTQQDNMDDMAKKGRQNHGEKCNFSKITTPIVLEIRRLYSEQKMTQDKIAKIYGVSRPLISMVVTRRVWTHV